MLLVRLLMTAAPWLATSLAAMGGPSLESRAELPWWDRAREGQVGPYLIRSDLAAGDALPLTRSLMLAHEQMLGRLGDLPTRAPHEFVLLLFEEEIDYEETLRLRYGARGHGTDAMALPRPSGSVLAAHLGTGPLRRLERALLHHAFHQFALSRFGDDLPVWVNEGLASLFGDSMPMGDAMLFGQMSSRSVETLKNAIELRTYVPFERMASMTAGQWAKSMEDAGAAGDASGGAVRHEQARSMVHFFLFADADRDSQPDAASRFVDYLDLLHRGFPRQTAMERAFGTKHLAEYERLWVQYALATRPGTFATALENIEFLAEGLRKLNEAGVQPETIEALRDELRAIKFSMPWREHGFTITFQAADDSLFTIPADAMTTRPPTFELEPPSLAGLSRQGRELARAAPQPWTIRTRYLRPRNLEIVWERDPARGEFMYEIEVR